MIPLCRIVLDIVYEDVRVIISSLLVDNSERSGPVLAGHIS